MGAEATNRILLAVKHADCEAALAFAIAEAHRRGCGVHVLHVARTLTGPQIGSSTAVDDELYDVGGLVLSQVATRGRRLAGGRDVPVSVELTRGPVVPAILHAADRACLVVLQQRHLADHFSHLHHSTTSQVAARSPVPVVAVDADWVQPDLDDRVVTVGVKAADTADAVVLAAAEAAQRTGARLRLVHAGGKRLTAHLPERFEGLDVEVVVSLWEPDRALMLHSQDSILLVVGRHASSRSHAHRLGKITRTVLGASQVPVMVVDPSTTLHPEVSVGSEGLVSP